MPKTQGHPAINSPGGSVTAGIAIYDDTVQQIRLMLLLFVLD